MSASKTLIAKSRQRARAKTRKLVHSHIGTDVFIAAQNGICPICSLPLADRPPGYKVPVDRELSVDHVYHLASTERHAGNILLVHSLCNQNKDDRHPTRGEQIMLGLVNRCLGYHKGVYKAARVGKGMPMPEIPHPDFYHFVVELLLKLYMKVFYR